MSINMMMEQGIARILKTASRRYLTTQEGRKHLTGLLPHMAHSARLRAKHRERGLHVPPLLIASIASQCNLRCAGCYARAGGGCGDRAQDSDMGAAQWEEIFSQASGLGVSFVLLAGGEPMLRRDILEAAARYPNMVFPLFTNGTLLDESYINLLISSRNILPVFSIEGNRAVTDARRGGGTYDKIAAAMDALDRRSILFGASVTVTSENLEQVTGADFLAGLGRQGCGLVFFVEYVPVEAGTEHLVLSPGQVDQLAGRVAELKAAFRDMVLVSFPGDEEAMGGCLAAGRGFFHINPSGGAEPCPFAPYSRHNLQTSSLSQVLRSSFFDDMRAIAAEGEHSGGCTLFAKRDQVNAYLGTVEQAG